MWSVSYSSVLRCSPSGPSPKMGGFRAPSPMVGPRFQLLSPQDAKLLPCCLASHLLSCLFQKQQISQGDKMPQLMGLPPLNSHLSPDLGLANLHYLFNSLMPFRLILFLFCPTSDIVLSRRAGSSGIVCCYQMVGNRNTGSESGLCASAHLT